MALPKQMTKRTAKGRFSPRIMVMLLRAEHLGRKAVRGPRRAKMAQQRRGAFNAQGLVPEPSIVRRIRWRSRIALPGQARDSLVLVPDLACPACCPRARQPSGRCAGAGAFP